MGWTRRARSASASSHARAVRKPLQGTNRDFLRKHLWAAETTAQSKGVERKGSNWSSPKSLVVGIKTFLVSTETCTRLSTKQNLLPAGFVDR